MIRRTSMLFAAWLLVNGTASAGGAYLPRSGTAISTNQRAIIVLEGNTTTLLLQSGFSGTASDLAWVVPINGIGTPQEMGFGPADAFSRLHEESAPQLVRLTEKRRKLGCSTEGKTFATTTSMPSFDGLSAANAEFFPLDATLSADVLDWLADGEVGLVCRDNATACDEDEDCGAPTVCQSEPGCINPNRPNDPPTGCCMNQFRTCGNDAECGGEVECFNEKCINLAPSCSDDTDCGGVTTCRNNYCMNLPPPECVDDTDCGGLVEIADPCLGDICTDDTTPCNGDGDCPNGETCQFTCVAGTENEGDDCTTDGDAACGVQQCYPDTCADGQSCSSDTDCGGLNECVGDVCVYDSSVDCERDEDCAGLIACVDGACEHGGQPCDDRFDCGGVTECRSHCLDQRIGCDRDDDCNMVCIGEKCRDQPNGGRVTDVACTENDDCEAIDECNTWTVNGEDLTLCTVLAPDCATDAACDTTCREFPVGGPSTCGGSFSEIPCSNDTPCSAVTECQQGICVNLTPQCTSDINCNVTTCDKPNRYPLGVICDTGEDCRSDECLRYDGKFSCSRECDLVAQDCPGGTEDIPLGFDCVEGAGGAGLCWPRPEPVPPGRCAGSDFRCFVDSDCAAETECRDRDAFAPFPVSGDASTWLTEYADDDAKFAVATLSAVAPASEGDLLAPLSILIGGNVPFFPLRTVDGSALELQLYIIAHERYRPANYASADVEIDQFFDGGSFDEWYAERIEQNFAATTEPTFLVEYADTIDLPLVDHILGRPASVAEVGANQWFLTKLRARLGPDDIDDDLRVVPSGEQRFVIRAVASGAASEAALGGFGILFAGGWGIWRARRRR